MLSGLSIFRECARKRKIKCPPCRLLVLKSIKNLYYLFTAKANYSTNTNGVYLCLLNNPDAFSVFLVLRKM